MKKNNRVPFATALCALLLVIGTSLQAEQTPSRPAAASNRHDAGTIRGRVKNAITGKYLPNARVSVVGSDLVTLTNAYGEFILAGVPGGEVTIEVFYTELDKLQTSVRVQQGVIVTQDVELTSSTRYGTDSEIAKLDPFLVAAERLTDMTAISTQEQRFAPNIKNVIATNSIGDGLGASVGDFLKFVPGLTADYDTADITAISVRGIGGGLTSFQVDGGAVVTGNIGSTRTVEMRTQAINSISRIEVTKVPTPSMPADSLGGTINMISKSAFERSKAELRYGINFVGTSNNMSLKKTARAYHDENIFKIRPGFDFDYTLPLGKNFGLVLTGMKSSKYIEQEITTTTWNSGTGTVGTNATVAAPYLQSFGVLNYPRLEDRSVYSGKADWRVTPNSVVSVSARWSRYEGRIAGSSFTPNVGTNGTPSVAGGTSLTFGPNFTTGATGRGTVTLGDAGQYFNEDSWGTNGNYRYDDGNWKVEGAVSYSGSERTRPTQEEGQFSGTNIQLKNPARISFLQAGPARPGDIRAYDNNNNEVDLYNLSNYRLNLGVGAPIRQRAAFKSGSLNVKRSFDFASVRPAFQLGAFVREQTLDTQRPSWQMTFNGPDGNPATVDPLDPYVYQTFTSQALPLGLKQFPRVSTYRLYQAWKANPVLFGPTAAQAVANETNRITGSEYINERVTAAFLQGEASFLRNRLSILAGVRFEKTDTRGLGPLFDPGAAFVRTASGSFARDTQGNRIRKVEAGAAGSLEELRLIRAERSARAVGGYQGYYPSAHATYKFSEKTQARFAFGRTYGRPDFSEIIPNYTLSQANLTEEALADPSVIRGDITARNPGLKPWTANNFDLSIEHYTEQGGIFSAGVFRKDIKDFFGTSVKLATASDLELLGLDSQYLGWRISTKFNSGDAKVTGGEINLVQSLRKFGGIGKYLTVFANGTSLRLEGNPYASFSSFQPRAANWGVSFNRNRLTISVRGNYKGPVKETPQAQISPQAFQYLAGRTTTDLNLAFQLNRRFSLFATLDNMFNVIPQVRMRYAPETPVYARYFQRSQYGVAFAFGVKGAF